MSAMEYSLGRMKEQSYVWEEREVHVPVAYLWHWSAPSIVSSDPSYVGTETQWITTAITSFRFGETRKLLKFDKACYE